MDEVKEAVNPTESAPVEKEVATQEPVSTSQATETSVQETSTQTQTQGNAEAVDEFGVPYKNRAFEWKRKAEDLTEKLPSLLEEAVQSALSKQGNNAQQREYTIAELEQYAISNPEHRPWVEEQKAQVIRKQLAKEVEEKFKTEENKKTAEVKKQQSVNYVMSTYPDAFLKNQNGQIMGWNQNHPLTQQIGMIMKDPRFANDPEGLMAAADIAYARFVRTQQPALKQKEALLQAEVKNLQKQTLVEGGGKSGVQVVPEHRALIEKAKQTGSVKDAAAALQAMAKARAASLEK